MAKETSTAADQVDPHPSIEDLQAENTALKLRVLELESAMSANIKVAIPVKGNFEVDVVVNGKLTKKKFKFVDGHNQVRIRPEGVVLPAEQLIKLFNGGKVTSEEIKAYPSIRLVINGDNADNGRAKETLTNLAQIGYGYLAEA